MSPALARALLGTGVVIRARLPLHVLATQNLSCELLEACPLVRYSDGQNVDGGRGGLVNSAERPDTASSGHESAQ